MLGNYVFGGFRLMRRLGREERVKVCLGGVGGGLGVLVVLVVRGLGSCMLKSTHERLYAIGG